MINKKKIFHFLILASTLFMVIFMVFHPREVFEASKAGLDAWLKIVFPALLPFFIGSELLMAYGLVRFLGVLLEPVMRPLFNLPGAASFVMAVGFTSGFPISSVLTAKLRKEGICTRQEAEHLMSFTNNASPLFMLGAVAVGMFNSSNIGYLLAATHYLANLTLGLLLRFYGFKNRKHTFPYANKVNIFVKALSEMNKSIKSETRGFGKILGDAIRNSIQTLLLIGGFVIVFSVIIKIMEIIGFTKMLAGLISMLVSKLGFPDVVSSALASGIWEVTLGTKNTSQLASPFLFKILATSFILGWSGICVHAQVASVVSDTDIKMPLFVICRFLQGILAALYSYLFIKSGFNADNIPVFKYFTNEAAINWWQITKQGAITFLQISLLLITLGLLIGICKETIFNRNRKTPPF